MRENFIQGVIEEVLGPRNGINEIMEHDPINEYLTGILIPKSIKLSVPNDDQFEKDGTNEFDESDDAFIENIETYISSDLDPRLRTKSFGISFVLNSENPIIDFCITWGRYYKGDEGWVRKPFYKIFREFTFDDDKIKVYDEKDGSIIVYIKKRRINHYKNGYYITISLVNNLIPNDIKFADTESAIFQPSIRINLKNNDFEDINFINNNQDELSFLYSNRKILARGHMCSAVWREIDYEEIFKEKFNIDLWPDGCHIINQDKDIKEFCYPDMRSEFVPLYPTPLPNFDIFGKDSELFNAYTLSECWDNKELSDNLIPLVNEYSKWIIKQEKKSSSLEEFKDLSKSIIEKQKEALRRIKKGIKLLLTYDEVKLAFCFANRCIYLQNFWSKKKKDFKWRSFQLAFFLMNIESLIDENSPCRDKLDLLWISTGGGKTEAYLGIMAFTMAYRRLTNGNYGGTSIISRYTLRLLSIQQFTRTLSLVTAAEYLRVLSKNSLVGWRPLSCDIETNWLYGSLQFSIGMWVGSGVTPNSLGGKFDPAMKILSKEENASSNPAQIIKCPVCGNWLSIPDDGLPENETLNIVIKSLVKSIDDIKNSLENENNIFKVDISNKLHKKEVYTLSITFGDKLTTITDLDSIFNKYETMFDVLSLHYLNPGYFGKQKIEGEFLDFEIVCTNPKCDLNNSSSYWSNSSPLKTNKPTDNNLYEIEENSPFVNGSRIRIPALTVDEQIYHQCPTVIIGTADKIARLAFEPRISSIFGNVSIYNRFSGYCKNSNDTSFPKNLNKKKFKKQKDFIYIDKFNSPDLIIQDELHLIDGPLGSLFGIYEAILSAIFKSNNCNPKYIASSATIKNAEHQCKLLFAKDLVQFPPNGLDIKNSFFVRESSIKDAWDEIEPGRVYLGFYSPGRGPMTPLIRLWAKILNTSYLNIGKNGIKYYWTVVGYFNAIRELGGGVALYREDIGERLKNISSKRILSDEKTIELSSRLPSITIPLELTKLENDGNFKDISKKPSYDAIFTTSMFGTGVDISHLGLMVVNGQPKTTGSYIQATGRIGRSYGGLVITFLRAGRPRDLDHYENFYSYHYKIHSNIEPISVSPFSVGSIEQAAGAAMVSYLRNSFDMQHNWDEDANNLFENAKNDFNVFFNEFNKRLNKIYGEDNNKINEIIKRFKTQRDRWFNVAKNSDKLFFSEILPFRNEYKKDIVLGDGIHENIDDLYVVYENAPISLREIEESTNFWVKK